MEETIPNFMDEIDGTRLPAEDSSPLLARGSDERELKGHASTFPDHARDPPQAPNVDGKKTYMVAIFCLTAALLYADQNLMAPNLTQIAGSFGFDEDARDKYLGGYIAAAFYIVGAPAALIFGYLSDTMNRRNLLFVAVMLGEGPCILTVFVTKYWQLLVLRILTGISLGGAPPLVFSLLGDMYEPKYRSSISAAIQVATGLGLAAGQGIAGFVGPILGWRMAFVIVAMPAIGLAILMILTTEEPTRGLSETSLVRHWRQSDSFRYNEKLTWRKATGLCRIPTNLLVILQGLPGCLPWGMLLTFLNDFLAQNKGLTVATATSVVLFVGVGGGAGVIGGGLLGQWLYNRSKWKMPVFIGVTTMLGTLPLLYLINAPVSSGLFFAYFAAFLTGVLSSTVGPNMRAMMMNVNEPETRGLALALQTMLDDLGKGLGPAMVAIIISRIGREAAFNFAACGWIPCGILLLCTAWTLERDEDAMQRRLQISVSRSASEGVLSKSSDIDMVLPSHRRKYHEMTDMAAPIQRT